MSKAALIHLTRQLALDLAPGVRVNAVAPSIIQTEGARHVYEGREEGLVATFPLKRLGLPMDVAYATVFLLSDEASWITGQDPCGGRRQAPQFGTNRFDSCRVIRHAPGEAG